MILRADRNDRERRPQTVTSPRMQQQAVKMATRNKLVTYDEAETRIGVLPLVAPRPTAKNLRIMTKTLIERLQAIPSYQSQRFGYMGFVTTPEEYALTGESPWEDYANPGFHRPLGGAAPQQRDLNVQFNVASNIYQSQENVRQAINNALTAAVPEAYRRAGGEVGPAVYTPTDNPRVILMGLQRRYGTRTPAEKEEATTQWGSPWNPTEPIENLFFTLEELYVQAVIARVPYTQEQLLDQALDKIKKTGLFIQNVVTWNALPPADKKWATFKAHLTRAYDAHLDSGPTAGGDRISWSSSGPQR